MFLCSTDFTDSLVCHFCEALRPIVSGMERVNVMRASMAVASVLTHEPVVPFWTPEEALRRNRPVRW